MKSSPPGAMLLVKAPEAAVVVDAFLHSETFLRIFQVRRHQALQGGSPELAAFSTLPLPDTGRLREIVKAPARYLNLSKAETEKLKSLSPTGDDLQSPVPHDLRADSVCPAQCLCESRSRGRAVLCA